MSIREQQHVHTVRQAQRLTRSTDFYSVTHATVTSILQCL